MFLFIDFFKKNAVEDYIKADNLDGSQRGKLLNVFYFMFLSAIEPEILRF